MLAELSRRDVIGVECVNVVICSILCLGLHKEQGNENQDFSASKEKHNSSAPIQLIGIDEVGEHGRKHQCTKLLANQGKCDCLRSRHLRCCLLSHSPTKATDGSSVKHGPSNHEGEKSSTGCFVRLSDKRSTSNDDGPGTKQCTTTNKRLPARQNI